MENKKFLKTCQKEVDTFRKVIGKLPEIKNDYGSINWKLVVPEKQKVIEKIAFALDISPKFISSMFTVNDRLETAGATKEVLISQMGQYLRFVLSKTNDDYVSICQNLIRLYFEELDEIIKSPKNNKKFGLF